MSAPVIEPNAVEGLAIDPGALRLDTPRGAAWVVDSVEKIPAEIRRAAFAGRSKDLRYYEVIERSLGAQFEHRYFILRDEASGAWAVQPLFFVKQDLLAGLPRKLRSLFTGIRKIFPRFLTMRILMIGCSAGEGELDHDGEWLPGAGQTGHATQAKYRPFAASRSGGRGPAGPCPSK